MENVQYHHKQAASRRSVSPLPPPPPPPSPPLSPESAAAEALANARWTPTVEQISVLEGLYREGMRTPSAEQIQRLTARLREHGPIEGKNIFYWFQNHKARQRQRQKQQTFDYFARQFHRPQPLPMLHHRAPGHPFPHAAPTQMMMTQAPPQHPASNRSEVMYIQQQQQQQAYMAGQAAVQAAYYSQAQQPPHYPRMDKQPRDIVRAQLTPSSGAMYYHEHPAPTNGAGTQQQPRTLHSSPATGGSYKAATDARPVQPQTLNLFPLHPTFAQREKKKTRRPRTASSAMPSASASTSAASFSRESEGGGSHSGEASVPPFYDFFSLGSGGR
uniref:Uncharacterized protein n=1 Tax=Avena sativa TaxID=4498 RepID=A0ACD5W512_AVESA